MLSVSLASALGIMRFHNRQLDCTPFPRLQVWMELVFPTIGLDLVRFNCSGLKVGHVLRFSGERSECSPFLRLQVWI